MRFTDLMMAFPPLLLRDRSHSILKPGLTIVVLVIALVNWVQVARVVYTETARFPNANISRLHAPSGPDPGKS